MYSNAGVVSPVRRRRRGPGIDAHLAQVLMCDVRSTAPALLPIFRSRLQGEILARLLLGPARELGLLELSRLVRGDLASVAREVTRLSRAGLLTLRRVGAGHLVSRNAAHPLTGVLSDLLLPTFGPSVVLEQSYGSVP